MNDEARVAITPICPRCSAVPEVVSADRAGRSLVCVVCGWRGVTRKSMPAVPEYMAQINAVADQLTAFVREGDAKVLALIDKIAGLEDRIEAVRQLVPERPATTEPQRDSQGFFMGLPPEPLGNPPAFIGHAPGNPPAQRPCPKCGVSATCATFPSRSISVCWACGWWEAVQKDPPIVSGPIQSFTYDEVLKALCPYCLCGLPVHYDVTVDRWKHRETVQEVPCAFTYIRECAANDWRRSHPR